MKLLVLPKSIDWIFHAGSLIADKEFNVVVRSDFKNPSDHLLIYADIELR